MVVLDPGDSLRIGSAEMPRDRSIAGRGRAFSTTKIFPSLSHFARVLIIVGGGLGKRTAPVDVSVTMGARESGGDERSGVCAEATVKREAWIAAKLPREIIPRRIWITKYGLGLRRSASALGVVQLAPAVRQPGPVLLAFHKHENVCRSHAGKLGADRLQLHAPARSGIVPQYRCSKLLPIRSIANWWRCRLCLPHNPNRPVW